MRFTRVLTLGTLLVAAAGCEDEPLKGPDQPPAPTQGIQAFLQVDRMDAKPGQTVNVFARVQIGTQEEMKLGSYTGRLQFNSAALAWKKDVNIDDGLRVVNPNNAGAGEIRFAGASARGFADLTIYHGVFEVKDADYLTGLALNMEELSAALTLTNMQPQLQVAPEVFQRQVR